MSNWRTQLEDDSGVAALTAWLGSYYHVLVLVGLLAFTLWNRARSWGNFVVDGTILFPGNDPWYHYRATSYAVEHFPNNIPFDPWTYFSYGTTNGQFGTLFDQSAALVALVVGMGNPSDELIRQVLLFTPPVLAVAIIPVAYVLGRRLGGDRFSGLASAALVTFSAGVLLRRSTVGFADHQVAEALLQALAGLAFVVAVTVAEQEKPIYELLAERNTAVLRRSLGWGALAGFATGLYIWVWPPGILMLGILGVFFLLYLNAEYLRGNSPEHLAIVGGVTALTAGVMNLATVSELAFRATGNSLLQPLLAFGLLAWLVLVSYQARVWDEWDLNPYGFPLLQFGVLAAGVVVLMVGFPTLYERLFRQVVKVLGFMFPQVANVGTIGETTPLTFQRMGELIQWHGFAGILALGGVVIVLLRQVTDEDGWGEIGLGALCLGLAAVAVVTGFLGLGIAIVMTGFAGFLLRFLVGREADPAEFFVVVWIGMIFAATLTQQRFDYYLVVPMAALAAVPIGTVMAALKDVTPDESGVQGYQVLAVATIVLVVVAPMFVFVGAGNSRDPIAGASSGPGPAIQGWADSLEWMDDNTPAEGTYRNPNGDEMEFQGTFPKQEDFDYDPGAYGVVSWWDYGHWITSVGQRIPNANPFQQGATDAARFLLALDETEAADALDRVDEDDAKTRYAIVDWKMVESMSFRPVRGKFFAPSTFHPNYSGYSEVTGNEFVRPVLLRQPTRVRTLSNIYVHKQSYYESMAVRLYRYHGSAQEPRNFVVDWERPQRDIIDTDGDDQADARANLTPRGGTILRQFRNRTAAEEYVRQDGSAQIGGIGPYPSERVPALQHYRLVQASDRTALQNSQRFGLGLIHTIQGANVTDLLAQMPRYQQFNAQQLTNIAINWVNPSSSAWSKVFERVPGATIRGNGPPNKTLTAAVQMQIPGPNGGTNFTYQQQASTGEDGTFEFTVPYSTTGYDNWGPETGATNVSVRALGPYDIRSGLERQEDGNLTYWGETTNVSEAAVIGEDTDPITVELEEQQPTPTRNITVGGDGSGEGSGDGGDGGDAGSADDGSSSIGGGSLEPFRMVTAPATRAGP